MVSFTLVSLYLSKPLTQTPVEEVGEKLNGVEHTKVGSIPSATSRRIKKKDGIRGLLTRCVVKARESDDFLLQSPLLHTHARTYTNCKGETFHWKFPLKLLPSAVIWS